MEQEFPLPFFPEAPPAMRSSPGLIKPSVRGNPPRAPGSTTRNLRETTPGAATRHRPAAIAGVGTGRDTGPDRRPDRHRALAAAADSGPAAGASAPAAEAEKAAAEAKRTGKPVEIVGLRTETDEVWANPNGTRTAEHALVPIRVRQGGKLIPVDTTLHKGTDGRLAPKAASIGLTFSGGGDSPLAVMSENGRDVALSWRRRCPSPGSTAAARSTPRCCPGWTCG